MRRLLEKVAEYSCSTAYNVRVISRRNLFAGALAVAAFKNNTLDLVATAVARTSGAIDAQDEDFWFQIQQAFSLDRTLANFNNGGCSPSPRIVEEALKRQLDFANQAPSNYMWRILEPEVESVRRGLAKIFVTDPEEIAITRNASESLENLIFGMNLQSGDEVVTTMLDYPRMITSIQQRERRDGGQNGSGQSACRPQISRRTPQTYS